MESNTKKKILLLAVKIAVSSILLTIVFRKAGPGEIVSHLRSADVRFFLLASCLYLISLFISALRWRLLLDSPLGLSRLFSLCLIGSFFNHLLPGAIGGDAVKAYYLYVQTKSGRSVASIFMDRYVGYAALLSISLVSGLIAFRELEAVRMQWISPVLFTLFVSASAVIFGMRIGKRFPIAGGLYDYFHGIIRQRATLAKAFFLSLIIQILTIFSVSLIAAAVGQRPPFMALFVFVPVIITVVMIPVSISGFGLRENAFVLLFGLTGISAEASTSISLLWFLAVAMVSLTGLVEYARYKRSGGPVR